MNGKQCLYNAVRTTDSDNPVADSVGVGVTRGGFTVHCAVRRCHIYICSEYARVAVKESLGDGDNVIGVDVINSTGAKADLKVST